MADVKLPNSAFVEFTDNGRVVERLGPAGGGGPIPVIPAGATVNPDEDGKLAAKYWAANKKTELHWFQGACAHAGWDGESLCSEADYDEAVASAKGITIGVQAHHTSPGLSSVVMDKSGTALKASPPAAVSPIPLTREPK